MQYLTFGSWSGNLSRFQAIEIIDEKCVDADEILWTSFPNLVLLSHYWEGSIWWPPSSSSLSSVAGQNYWFF